MTQHFGQSDFPGQNTLPENLRMKELRRVGQKDCWKVESQIERRTSKRFPVDSDWQKKIGGKIKRARSGQVDCSAGVPSSRVNFCLNISRGRLRLIFRGSAKDRQVISQ